MARVIFSIDKGPIQCPRCKKFITPLNKVIVGQFQNKIKIRCTYCGHEFEITKDEPDFYTFTR
ncbi:MAG: hypothetical protein ACTSR3_04320 [Candidatus Helarchaeota archaeon]